MKRVIIQYLRLKFHYVIFVLILVSFSQSESSLQNYSFTYLNDNIYVIIDSFVPFYCVVSFLNFMCILVLREYIYSFINA